MGYKTQNSVTQPIRHRYEEILCRQKQYADLHAFPGPYAL